MKLGEVNHLPGFAQLASSHRGNPTQLWWLCPVTERALSFFLVEFGLPNRVTWKLYQGLVLKEEGKTSVGRASPLPLGGHSPSQGPGSVRNQSRRLGIALWRVANI